MENSNDLINIILKIKLVNSFLKKSFWAQIYDRLQTRAATLLIPLSYFVDADLDPNSQMQTSYSKENSKSIIFINEQLTKTLINVRFFAGDISVFQKIPNKFRQGKSLPIFYVKLQFFF